VRHALAQAIDRQFIIDNIYYGTAKAAGSNIPAVFTAYNDEASFQYPYDPAKAATLLDAAGYPKGADGTRFSLRLTFLPGDSFKKTAEYIRSSFGELGVKVDIVDGDLATFIKRVYTDRDFDININGISRLFDPTAGVQRLYWSDGIKNISPYVNAAHYNNPEVDDLFRSAAVEVDETKRAETFKRIQAIVGVDLPNFSIIALPTVIARNVRINDIVTTIDIASSDLATAWKQS
jgi:peptide/nickel transport system substrate-binding protein